MLVAWAAVAVMVHTAAAQRAAPTPDSGAFVTRLGADTLALERFVRTPTEMRATVVLRVPRTTLTHHRARLSPAGLLEELRAVTVAPLSGAATPVRASTWKNATTTKATMIQKTSREIQSSVRTR